MSIEKELNDLVEKERMLSKLDIYWNAREIF